MMRVIELTGEKQLDMIPTPRPTYEPFSDRIDFIGSVQCLNERIREGATVPSRFQLVSRGFHWIQENPFNK